MCVVSAVAFVVSGCSSGSSPRAASQPESTKLGSLDDASACEKICAASEACGDTVEACAPKCNAWLVERSPKGIAQQTAVCAVPRIERACIHESDVGAARALVTCVDEAGRNALKKNNANLVVAAHAICERGARCAGASEGDAAVCVQRIVNREKAPPGMGLFGAVRPDVVRDFAKCLQAVSCSGNPSVCFAGMMGEQPDDGEPQQTPPPSSKGPVPDTKI